MAATNADADSKDVNAHEEYNILLLGETGVGKSTFINAFVNFLQHTTFNNARMSELACLIPLKFVIPNEYYEEQVIQFGYDQNEDTVLGNSSTQETKAYVFPFENHSIRLIDTPGIGDARGLKQDERNFENVLDHIGQYEKLHAICFLLKPNVTVLNAYFKFCIMHLVSRLEKSAVDNIIFIFTNSRNTFYRPGETLPLLKRILKEIKDTPPHIEVPLSKKNMFCIDNEAFKFLISMRRGIRFEKAEIAEFRKSWRTSYKTCRDLIYYICGGEDKESITPHNVENTVSVNKARRAILNLMRPIADTVEYILDNITILQQQFTELKEAKLSKEELCKKLYMPKIEHKIIQLSHPMTVCTSPTCSELFQDGRVKKWKNNTICHENCCLTYIPVNIIGSPELLNCAIFCNGSVCTKCYCHFGLHKHLLYEIEVVESIQENQAVKAMINTKKEAIEVAKQLSETIKQYLSEYNNELQSITTSIAKFFHFLKNNSISACNDDYLEYLTNIIEREKSTSGFEKSIRFRYYDKLHKSYLTARKKLNDSDMTVTAKDIPELVTSLYDLPLTGSQISMFHANQKNCIVKSLENQEYKYPKLMKTFTDIGTSSDEDDDSNDYMDDKMDASTVFCPNIREATKNLPDEKKEDLTEHDASAMDVCNEDDDIRMDCEETLDEIINVNDETSISCNNSDVPSPNKHSDAEKIMPSTDLEHKFSHEEVESSLSTKQMEKCDDYMGQKPNIDCNKTSNINKSNELHTAQNCKSSNFGNQDERKSYDKQMKDSQSDYRQQQNTAYKNSNLNTNVTSGHNNKNSTFFKSNRVSNDNYNNSVSSQSTGSRYNANSNKKTYSDSSHSTRSRYNANSNKQPYSVSSQSTESNYNANSNNQTYYVSSQSTGSQYNANSNKQPYSVSSPSTGSQYNANSNKETFSVSSQTTGSQFNANSNEQTSSTKTYAECVQQGTNSNTSEIRQVSKITYKDYEPTSQSKQGHEKEKESNKSESFLRRGIKKGCKYLGWK